MLAPVSSDFLSGDKDCRDHDGKGSMGFLIGLLGEGRGPTHWERTCSGWEALKYRGNGWMECVLWNGPACGLPIFKSTCSVFPYTKGWCCVATAFPGSACGAVARGI